MNLIAVHGGLTAWTPSQEVHGHSHDRHRGTWPAYIYVFRKGPTSTWIKRSGYTEKIEM